MQLLLYFISQWICGVRSAVLLLIRRDEKLKLLLVFEDSCCAGL